MALQRRTFLGLGSLAACRLVLNPRSLFAAAEPTQAPLFADNEAVLAFVGKYSKNYRVVGVAVLGRIRGRTLRTLHVLAEVQNPNDLATAFAKVPFADVHAQDNSLSFALDGVDVTVENLLPDVFTARMSAMAKPSGNAFAHDALAYDPQTKSLSDPFAARAGVLHILNKDFLGAVALNEMLRGLLEAGELGLKEGEDFARWKRNVLGWTASPEMAPKYARSFLRPLATLADELPAASIETMVRSHLISGALQQTVGVEGVAASAAFRQARAKASAATTEAALWLAALLGPEIRNSAATGGAMQWLQGGTSFQVARSRAALAQAESILQS